MDIFLPGNSLSGKSETTCNLKKNTVNLQLLPTPVDPEEAEEMFDFADKNKDSKIGWEEFQVFHFHISFQFYKKQDKKFGVGRVSVTSLSLSRWPSI